MDLKTVFENLASTQSPAWGFEYARNDYQNLIDSTDFISDALEGYGVGETIMFVDPMKRGITSRNQKTYSGSFMVLTKSDLDKDYDDRFTLFIEPLIDLLMVSFRNKLKCEYDINTWESTEIINMFDWNADGLLITYNIIEP
jgi:hypothetical protein